MKERPILFSSPMIRSLRANAKTQTRRTRGLEHVNAEPGNWRVDETLDGWMFTALDGPAEELIKCPYGVSGDRLKVVEISAIPNISELLYAAGSDGNIYSYSTARTNSKKDKPFPLSIKRSPSSEGYPVVTIYDKNAARPSQMFSAHVLVCSAFHGERPFPTAVVRHLDGDENNSSPANLKWGTKAENEADKRRHGRTACGESQGHSKLTEDAVDLIRRTYPIGLVTAERLGEFYGVTPHSIRRICRGESWVDVIAEEAPPLQYEDVILQISSVSVERLQCITEADAIAEGCEECRITDDDIREAIENPMDESMALMVALGPGVLTARLEYAQLWNSLNDKPRYVKGAGFGGSTKRIEDGRYGWSANPWLWRLEFRRLNT